MNEINTFSALYENMQVVLEKPAKYTNKITRFSYGGCCGGSSDDVNTGELARCWKHEEYHIKCLHCKDDAYITFLAGNVSNGGFWEIKAYCPHCRNEYRYDKYNASAFCNVHWTTLRKILQEEKVPSSI